MEGIGSVPAGGSTEGLAMKKLLMSVLLAVLLTASALGAIGSPASAATYQGDTFEELIQDPTLHNQHSVVIRFYAAVFARIPDNGGIRFWLDQYDTGEWSTRRIADFFVTSDEFKALYGENTTNAQFVDAVYPNVLGRTPDQEGRSFWIGYLDAGNSRAEMILLVSNSPEFIAANPLPSDDRAIPAPIDTTRFFDGLMGYNGVPEPVANDISAGTAADFYLAYLSSANAEFGADPATGRTAVIGGYRYTFSNRPSITLTNPLLDVSGRVAHFDINGVPLLDLSRISSVGEIPSLGIEYAAYQYITTLGETAIRVVFINNSGSNRETFAFDWTFNSPTAGSSKSTLDSSGTLIPPGGSLNALAWFAADGIPGGSVTIEVFFDENGSSFAEEIEIFFE